MMLGFAGKHKRELVQARSKGVEAEMRNGLSGFVGDGNPNPGAVPL
jgi:hypothetical protein